MEHNVIEEKSRQVPALGDRERDDLARKIRRACARLEYPWLTASQIEYQMEKGEYEVRQAMRDLKARILIQEADDGYRGSADTAWAYLRRGVSAGRILSADAEKVVFSLTTGQEPYLHVSRLLQFIRVADDLSQGAGPRAMDAGRDCAQAVELLQEIEIGWRDSHPECGPEEVLLGIVASEPQDLRLRGTLNR